MITIVSDTEPALGKAVAIAASLKQSHFLQAYEMSPTVAGVDLTLHPATANIVQEKGGYEAYETEVLQKFVAAGFKKYEVVVKALEEVPLAPVDEPPVDEEPKNE